MEVRPREKTDIDNQIKPDSLLENIDRDKARENGEKQSKAKLCMKEVFSVINFSAFKKPYFLIYTITCFLTSFGEQTAWTYIPDYAKGLGINHQRAALLISIAGISEMLGRVVLCCTDKRERFYAGGTVLMIGGIVSAAISLFSDYTLLLIFSIICGLLKGMSLNLYF